MIDLTFPWSLDELTPQWLSRALSVKYPGTEVLEARRGTIIAGMATKVQFHLTYNDAGAAHGLPPSVWVKTGFESHSERSAELYAAEVNFFRDVAPVAGIGVPATYFEAIDPQTGNGLLIMEDLSLRDVTFGDPRRALHPDVVANLLEIQARYHTFLDRAPSGLDLGWLRVGGAIHSVDVVGEYLPFWDTAAAAPRWAFVPPELDDPPRIRRALYARQELDLIDPVSMLHGDPHLGNLFFDHTGTGSFLDWQTVMRGAWGFDVAYFIVNSMSVEDRRRHERDLLSTYLDAVRSYRDHAPSFDEAWQAYRRHAMWTFLTVLCPVERQPEEVCLAHAERVCAALVDLETLESLDVPLRRSA